MIENTARRNRSMSPQPLQSRTHFETTQRFMPAMNFFNPFASHRLEAKSPGSPPPRGVWHRVRISKWAVANVREGGGHAHRFENSAQAAPAPSRAEPATVNSRPLAPRGPLDQTLRDRPELSSLHPSPTDRRARRPSLRPRFTERPTLRFASPFTSRMPRVGKVAPRTCERTLR